MSANQSHAVNSQTQSAVPNAVQNAAPKGLEESLPDSVSLASCLYMVTHHNPGIASSPIFLYHTISTPDIEQKLTH